MPSPPQQPPHFPLDPHKLTWAALLGRWIEFARAATVLPNDDQSERVKRLVPDIIGLQAVWFALHHLDELDAPQRALGLDRAAVLIEKHERAIRTAWPEGDPPEALVDLIRDAHQQWRAARGEP